MHFLLTLLLQIGVILVAARLVGALCRLLRQPVVVGEMAAGILLGPSLLGWAAPELSAALFPPESLIHLGTVSQIGLLLFMFLVGVEFDPKLMRGRGHAALVTSHVSIIAPFFLGSILALHLYPRLSDDSVEFSGFALFMGAAMSVTAFPVLARILVERNLLKTKVGAVTIACAAVDDVTAWSILAVVIALVRSHAATAPLWVTLVGTVVYVGMMVTVVRRGLGWLERRYQTHGRLSQDVFAALLLGLLASAWITEYIGIHALFGAFCFGAIVPKDRGLVHELTAKLEDVTIVFLLPLFFANAGLRTSIGLIQGAEMWAFFALIMVVAVAGKFGGSTLSARMTGLSWREAGALGILMNTRGLMELVILTIGLELGVISPALFAMMVLMALATTAMTTPILQWLYPLELLRANEAEENQTADTFVAVLPVALARSGPGLLRVAQALVPAGRTSRTYAVHLHPSTNKLVTDFDSSQTPDSEAALLPLLRAAKRSRVEDVRPMSFVSQSLSDDIVDVARFKGAELVVLGWHKPIVLDRVLGGVVGDVLERATADVAVYIERNFEVWQHVLVPVHELLHDEAALDAAARIAINTGAEITVLRVLSPGAPENELPLPEPLTRDDVRPRVHVRVVRSPEPIDAVVEELRHGAYQLALLGIGAVWGLTPAFFGPRHERLVRETSVSLLLVRKYGPSRSVRAPANALCVARGPSERRRSPAA